MRKGMGVHRWRDRAIHFAKTVSIVGGIFVLAFSLRQSARAQTPNKKTYRILHVASYHTPWAFTDEQERGFKNALEGVKIEYKAFYMDAKRKSSETEKAAAGKRARDLIDAWKPDLVYTTDDDAQQYVAKHYVNGNLPFVFGGVNGEPEDLGLVGAKNICGVLERFHFIGTLDLLRETNPSIRTIAAISDDAPMWVAEIQRAKKLVAETYTNGEIEFVAWDRVSYFKDYQEKIHQYQTEADALVLFGQFTLKDENGAWVPYVDVQKWTVANSRLPDCSFAELAVKNGTLVVIAISSFEQGRLAGVMAKEILTQGKSPSVFGIVKSSKGAPMVNLKRAKQIGVNLRSGVLLSATVIDRYEWDK